MLNDLLFAGAVLLGAVAVNFGVLCRLVARFNAERQESHDYYEWRLNDLARRVRDLEDAADNKPTSILPGEFWNAGN